jgi:Putative porin
LQQGAYWVLLLRQASFLSLILVMKFRRYINWVVLLIGIPTVHAQEGKHLDDTPQDVYNPTTTLFTTQENIQYNQKGYEAIADDMSISGIHRFTFVQQHGNKLQNLGNNGTATKPIFYTMPHSIGAVSGFSAYDIYFRSPHQVRYYDTKSPYSKMHVMLARFGSFHADICHSRNVTPNWNIGANFRNIMTDKEWIPEKNRDKNVISYGLDFFTHYKTDSENYQLLAHLLLAKHRVRETGGIYTNTYLNSKKNIANTKHTIEQEIWRVRNIMNRLGTKATDLKKNPESSDARKQLHVYHQLAITEQLWGYHELEIQKKKHQFKAESLLDERNRKFLRDRDFDVANAIETTTAVWDAQNELGIKGNRKNWFYCGYFRHKKIELRPQQEKDNQDLHEYYVGLRTRYQRADSNDFLHLSGEYLFQGYYKARVAYEGANFDLACEQIKHKSSLLAQCYHGYHRNWNQQFTPPTATQISGGLRLVGNGVQLRPHASFTRITDHIYFEHQFKGPTHLKQDQRYMMLAVPKQAKQHADIVVLGTDMDLAFGAHIRWDSEVTAAKALESGAKELFNMPSLLINSRLYYTDTTAVGNGTFETGIDVHWKSSYMADGYDPVTQQFYLQDECSVYGYPIIDLFLNFRIKSFSAFLKFSHCNESWLAPASGYFVTPLYPGQRKAFDIGLSWSFFD